MSRPVDDKIIKLKMDNADFKKKATESVGLMGKLSNIFSKAKNLNLDKSVKGINDVNNAASKTTLSALTDSISGVTTKFSALNVIAMTALSNITNRAINAGMQLGQALTIQPMTDGFNEYELKMKSIQTIMSNTKDQGTKMSEVTDTLDELNTYADKTIYSFADMTSNIGTFTAAGVNLKDSATAIQGISNLAAASGSNTQQASSAMYQLSQALANGKVNLQDWNSVVNAGMGGKLFQNALQKTAEGMGQNIDKSKSFRDSLQDGWLTTDVLIKTLGEFAKDESMLEAATKVRTFTQLVDTAREALGSGWATTWETLFGGFDEAGAMWTNANNVISAMIDKSAKARNDMLADFVKIGGRAALIKSVSNAFKGLTKMLSAAREGMKKVFPPQTATSLMQIVKGIQQFTEKLIISDATAKKITTIFQGLFSVLDSGIHIAKTIGRAILDMIPEGAGGSILDLAVNIAELLIKFNQAIKGSTSFKDALSALSGGIKKALTAVMEFGKGFGDSFGKIFDAVGRGFGAFTNLIGPAIQWVVQGLGKLADAFDFRDVMTVGFLATMIAAFKKFSKLGNGLGDMIETISDSFSGIGDAIKNIGGISDALSAMTTAVNVGSLIGIAVAVGILALSIGKIADLDFVDISKGLEVIGVSMVMLHLSLKAMSKLDFGGGMMKATLLIMSVAASVLILSSALKKISTLKPEELAVGMAGLAGTMVILVGAMKLLSKNAVKMTATSGQLLAIAVSISILASAVTKLAEIDTGGLAKGVVTIGIILAELAIFLKVADSSKLGPGSAAGLLITSGAVLVMVQAIKQISNIEVNSLEKGLVTIGLILAELAIFSKAVSGSKMLGASVGLAITAAAITTLIIPISKFASMSLDELAKGLGAMAVALGLIVGSMKLASGSIGGAVGITIMAAAINALVPPIVILGSLSLTQIATALGVLAGAFIIMGGAAKLVGISGSLALLSFAAAIGAVGLAIGLIGVGFLGFAVALTTLAGITAGGIAAIILSLGLLLTGIGTLIPELAKLAVDLVIAMAVNLARGGPIIIASGLQLILGLITAMAEYAPRIVTVALELITGLINALAENVGPLIDAGVNLIVKLITGMADGIRQNQELIVGAVLSLLESILEIIVTALQAIVDVLFGWIPGVSSASAKLGDGAKEALRGAFNNTDLGKIGDDGATSYTKGIEGKNGEANAKGKGLGDKAKEGAGSVKLSDTGANAGGQFTKGVGDKAGEARSKGKGLGDNAKSGAGSVSLSGAGNTSGQSFADGIGGKSGNARSAGSNLGNSADSGARSKDLTSAGAWAGQGFASGIASKAGDAWEAAKGLATRASDAVAKFLKINSPSKVMAEQGMWFGKGFSNGISGTENEVGKTAKNLGETAKEAATTVLDSLMDMFNQDYDLSPVITPILDSSNLTKFNMPNKFKMNANDLDGSAVAGNVNITINGYNKDPKELAKEIEKIIVRGVQS